MAKGSGLGDQFYIAGFDLSGDVASIDTISGPSDVFEWTTIKQFAHQRGIGLRSSAISFTSLFENTATVSTPAVPASGTPVNSTFNQLVYVNIVGGTMTNVVVNGVSVGTGAGLYQIPALGYITLTYSVAPTWTWFSLAAEHNALKTEQGGADAIANYFHGSAIGNAALASRILQTDYDPTRDNSGNLTLKVDLTGDGFGTEWGQMLTPGIRADLAATNGASLDQGAGFVTPGVPLTTVPVTNTSPLPATVVISSGTITSVNVGPAGLLAQVGTGAGTYTVPAGQQISITYSVAPTWTWTLQTLFGAQAYLQLFNLIGTNVDVVIQHAPDNATWTTLIDFASQTTSPLALRTVVSNVTTVQRWLRVITTGTFSLAQFAVMLNRNPVAGVAF